MLKILSFLNPVKLLAFLTKLQEALPYLIPLVETLTKKDINGNGKVGE